MNEIEQFLNESQADIYPSMKFQKLNDFIKGTIVDVRLDKRDSRFHPGEIDTSLLVSLDVIQGRGVVGVKTDETRAQEQPVQDHSRVTVWIKQGFMAAALAQAVRDAGVKTLLPGGVLTMVFVDEKDTGKGNPAKLYKASYQPPAKQAFDDFLDDGGKQDDIPF